MSLRYSHDVQNMKHFNNVTYADARSLLIGHIEAWLVKSRISASRCYIDISNSWKKCYVSHRPSLEDEVRHDETHGVVNPAYKVPDSVSSDHSYEKPKLLSTCQPATQLTQSEQEALALKAHELSSIYIWWQTLLPTTIFYPLYAVYYNFQQSTGLTKRLLCSAQIKNYWPCTQELSHIHGHDIFSWTVMHKF